MDRFAADEGTDDTRQIKFHRAANKGYAIWPRLEWCSVSLISLFLLI